MSVGFKAFKQTCVGSVLIVVRFLKQIKYLPVHSSEAQKMEKGKRCQEQTNTLSNKSGGECTSRPCSCQPDTNEEKKGREMKGDMRREKTKWLEGGIQVCFLKIRLYILVIVSTESRGRETREERGFIKQREKVSKTDSYIDKSGMLKVFTF